MVYNSDFRSAAELTAAARAAVENVSAALPLEAWFPTVENPTLTYNVDANDLPGVDIATFRDFDTEAPYGRAAGGVTKTGKLPPISRKLPVSEYTELTYSGRTDSIGDLLDRKAANLAVGVAFRLEFARAEVLTTSKLVLNENGLVATIDFGRDASLTPTLAQGKKWSSADATPIDDILGWLAIKKLQGRPTSVLMTADVMDALSKNKQIIGMATGRGDNLPGRVSYDAVRGVLASYGFSTVTVIDDAYSGLALDRPVFPAGTFALLPSAGISAGGGALGSTQVGIPAEAMQPSYGISGPEQAGVFAAAFDRTDPVGLDVLVSAIALPVPSRINSTVSVTVL